jgi:MFS transporter, ACDE family, multidrug resistance protein
MIRILNEILMKNSGLFFNKNLQIIFAVTLMAVLGVSSITPAFPKIARQLNLTSQQVGLLITVFTLPGVVLTPVLGVLADRLGRKKILIPSLLLFGLAGFLCTFARDFDLLLLLRLLQGTGAASLGSLNVTLIGDFFEGRQRAAAMGYNASILSVGTATYPAIGGALATIAWYMPFTLPVLALPVAFVVLFSLQKVNIVNEKKLKDYLLTAWKNIRDIRIIGIFIASISTFIILYGAYLTYFPFLLDHSFKAKSLLIGILMSVMSFTTAITSFQLGRLTIKFSERTLLKAAFVLYTISLLIIPFISIIWIMIVPLVLFGAAQGLNIPSLQTLLADLAPSENRAAFMSINGMVLRLGQTLGPLIMGFIFGIAGVTGVYISGAVLAAVMFVLIFLMIKKSPEEPGR